MPFLTEEQALSHTSILSSGVLPEEIDDDRRNVMIGELTNYHLEQENRGETTFPNYERKEAKQKRDYYRDMFSSPERASEMGGEGFAEIDKHSANPQEEKAKSVLLSYMAETVEGSTPEGIAENYDTFKNDWATQILKRPISNIGDTELFSMIGEKFKKDTELEEFRHEGRLGAHDLAIKAITGGDISKGKQEYIESLPEDISQFDRDNLVRGFDVDYDKRIEATSKYAGKVNPIIEAFKVYASDPEEGHISFNVQHQSAKAEAKQVLQDAFIGLKDDPDLQEIMAIVADTAKQDPDGFGAQMDKALGRGITGMIDTLQSGASKREILDYRKYDSEVPRGFTATTIEEARSQLRREGEATKSGFTRLATTREKKLLREVADEMEGELTAIRQIKGMLESHVDPVVQHSDWAIEKGLYDFMGLVPQVAIGITAAALTRGASLPTTLAAGTAVQFPIIASQRSDEFLEEGYTLEQAVKLGDISASMEAPMESFGNVLVLGQLPWLNKFATKWSGKLGLMGTVKKEAILLGARIFGENLTEAGQDFTPIMVAEAAEALSKEFPESRGWEKLDRYAAGRESVFWAMLPMNMLGIGGAAINDGMRKEMAVQFGGSVEAIRLYSGTTEKIAIKITKEKNLLKRAQMIEDLEVDNAKAETYAFALNKKNLGKPQGAPGPRVEKNDQGLFTVTFPDDTKPYKSGSAAMAQKAADRWTEDWLKANQKAPVEKPEQKTPDPNTKGIDPAPDLQETEVLHSDRQLDALPENDVNPVQVIGTFEKLMKSLGMLTPIRNKRLSLGEQGAAGEHHRFSDVIRTQGTTNVPVAAHEVAHAIEKKLFGDVDATVWAQDAGLSKEAQVELIKLGRAIYSNPKHDIPPTAAAVFAKDKNGKFQYKSTDHAQMVREGFAEYVRMKIKGDPMATMAPEFDTFFDAHLAKLEPKAQKAFAAAGVAYKQWDRQGDAARGMSRTAESVTMIDNWTETVKELSNKDEAIANYFESNTALLRYQQLAERLSGVKLEPSNKPFEQAQQLMMAAAPVAHTFIARATRDWKGTRTGESFADIMLGLMPKRTSSVKEFFSGSRGKKVKENFSKFLHAMRVQAIHQQHTRQKKKGNTDFVFRHPGMSEKEANAVVKELGSIEFQDAATRVYQWNDRVLNYFAEASPAHKALVEKIRKDDAGNYAPLQRVGKDGGSKAFKARVETDRMVKNTVDSYLANTMAVIQSAHDARILDQVITISESISGMGSQMNDITKKGDEVTTDQDSIGDSLLQFKEASAKFDENKDFQEVSIWRDGQMKTYEIATPLYKAVISTEMQALGGGWLILTVPAKLARAGITSASISFSMVTNLLRDPQGMWINTKAKGLASTFSLMSNYGKSFGSLLVDAVPGMQSKEAWTQWYLDMGGKMANQLEQDKIGTANVGTAMFTPKGFNVATVAAGWNGYLDMLQFSESAPRLAEIRTLAQEMGVKDPRNLTEEQAQELMIAGKQVTTDFSASGRKARFINQVVPFFNAGIQGPRANARAFKKNPTAFLLRGAALTAATVANWLRNREDPDDEDFWNELKQKDKYRFTFVRSFRKDGGWIKIPRDFTTGGLFQAMPEAILDSIYSEHGPELALETAKLWIEELEPTRLTTFATRGPREGIEASPLVQTPLVKLIAEQMTGDNFYFDSPIVSRGLQSKTGPEQYDERTSNLAIAIANSGLSEDLSPQRIDHAIATLAGTVGREVAGVFGRGADKQELENREGEAADMFVIGRLFARGGNTPYYTKSEDEFYDAAEYAKIRHDSSRIEESEEQNQIRLQMTDARRAVSAIGKLMKQFPKKADRDKLQKIKTQIVKEALATFKSEEVDRDKFQAWRKGYEDQVKELKESKESK